MARFTEDVKVLNRISDRVHDWELCEVVRYYLVDPDGEAVHVPPDFVTDFASVPRPFWFWIAPCGRHGRAAILHDLLYQLGSVTVPGGTLRRPSKREADRVFRQAMRVLSTGAWSVGTPGRPCPQIGGLGRIPASGDGVPPTQIPGILPNGSREQRRSVRLEA